MSRTVGAQNVVPFGQRPDIATSSNQQIRHTAAIVGSPVYEFQQLLKHQENFLNWIDQRHQRVVELKRQINPASRAGAKTETFIKYRWYSEQMTLLDAINAFETFFKKTFVRLGETLRDYIEPDVFKDMRLDPSVIWSTAGRISAAALLFEHGLFHDLEAIDQCAFKLIGARRYNQKGPVPLMQSRVKALRAIFQIRHTMSHNHGLVTESDSAKFRRLKYEAPPNEIIDPAKDHLGTAIFRELRSESQEFTVWLGEATADFLITCINSGSSVPTVIRDELEQLFGPIPSFGAVGWS